MALQELSAHGSLPASTSVVAHPRAGGRGALTGGPQVPHNIADFAILIQNGFSHRAALRAQFVSAVPCRPRRAMPAPASDLDTRYV
jgi:hypothetical protein